MKDKDRAWWRWRLAEPKRPWWVKAVEYLWAFVSGLLICLAYEMFRGLLS